jgi:hypothetical protein
MLRRLLDFGREIGWGNAAATLDGVEYCAHRVVERTDAMPCSIASQSAVISRGVVRSLPLPS